MREAKYIGPLRELRNKLALIQPDGNGVKAQFHGNEDWRIAPKFKLKHPVTGAYLCSGWTHFDKGDFEYTEEPTGED